MSSKSELSEQQENSRTFSLYQLLQGYEEQSKCCWGIRDKVDDDGHLHPAMHSIYALLVALYTYHIVHPDHDEHVVTGSDWNPVAEKHNSNEKSAASVFPTASDHLTTTMSCDVVFNMTLSYSLRYTRFEWHCRPALVTPSQHTNVCYQVTGYHHLSSLVMNCGYHLPQRDKLGRGVVCPNSFKHFQIDEKFFATVCGARGDFVMSDALTRRRSLKESNQDEQTQLSEVQLIGSIILGACCTKEISFLNKVLTNLSLLESAEIKKDIFNTSMLHGASLFDVAISLNDAEVVKLLLNHGATVSCVNSFLQTPLHLSCCKEVAEVLLQHGASVSAKNQNGNTPLQSALRTLNIPVVEVLLQHGADASNKSSDGKTALMIACQHYNDQKAAEMVQLLLHYGADPSVQDDHGDTALHQAITHYETTNVIEVLLKNGVNPNVQNSQGRTPLHFAALNNNLEVARWLLRYGADVNIRNVIGQRPMDCVTGFTELMDLLQS